MWFTLGLVLSVGAFFVLLLKYLEKRKRIWKYGSNRQTELLGKHVVITGGSSGIGLCVASEVARRGANVSIIARSREKLEEAKREISKHSVFTEQKVVDCSLDITTRDTSLLESELKGLAETQGPIFMLVNCAGLSIPSKLETLTLDQVSILFYQTSSLITDCSQT